jgi:serine/threonine-protein kinase
VKVLDFGIARIHTLGTARLTATGTTLGTPYYMAPEQAEGRTDIDHRVDIYAAGVVLYEALAGRTPYVGSNYNALLAQVLREEPPPIETFRPGLDPAVIRVVRTAMQRKPEDRFASAEAMIEALLPFGAARTPFERPSRGPSEMPDAGRAQAMLPTLATGSAAPPPAAASAATVIPAAAPAAASRVPSISPVGQAAVTGEGGDVPPPRLRSRQLLAFAAVLAVALGAGAFLLLSGGDDRPTERTGTGPSSGSQAQPDGTFFAPPLPPSPHVVPTALPTGKAVVLPAEGAAAGAQSPDAVFDSVDARMLPVLPADDGGRISASRTDAGRRPARDAGTDSPGSTISGPSGTKVRTSYE